MFFFKNKEEEIVKQYKKLLYQMADALDNLTACGRCVGWDKLVENFTKIEEKYIEAGFRTISWNDATNYVGWGGPEPKIGIKRELNEDPIRYSDLISPTYDLLKKELEQVGVTI
jgi:hypothetical protein